MQPESFTSSQNAALILWYLLFRSRESKEQIKRQFSPETYYSIRLSLSSTAAGMASGAYLSGQSAGMQFLAENAHRLPITKGGWFMYHKYKNNAIIFNAGRGALMQGVKFTMLTCCYCGLEQSLESHFGNQVWNGMAAGTMTASAFSMLGNYDSNAARLPFSSARVAVGVGALSGLGIGLLQETYLYIYGESIKNMPK